jgi:hypothetical protein
MLDLIKDSGFGAWPVLLLTLGGIAAVLTLGRSVKRPGSVAAAFALAALAAGALAFAMGQRAVESYVIKLPGEDLAGKIEGLAVGTREASGGLMLAGACALVLLSLGGILALKQGKSQ